MKSSNKILNKRISIDLTICLYLKIFCLPHFFKPGPIKYSSGVKSSRKHSFMNKVLLAHRHTHLLTYYLKVTLSFRGGAQQLCYRLLTELRIFIVRPSQTEYSRCVLSFLLLLLRVNDWDIGGIIGSKPQKAYPCLFYSIF